MKLTSLFIVILLILGSCNSKQDKKTSSRQKIESSIETQKVKHNAHYLDNIFKYKYSIDFDTILNKNIILELLTVDDIYKKDSLLYCRLSSLNLTVICPISELQLKQIKDKWNNLAVVKLLKVRKLDLETNPTLEANEVLLSLPSSDNFICNGELIDIINYENDKN